jgi:hypothetical protein
MTLGSIPLSHFSDKNSRARAHPIEDVSVVLFFILIWVTLPHLGWLRSWTSGVILYSATLCYLGYQVYL